MWYTEALGPVYHQRNTIYTHYYVVYIFTKPRIGPRSKLVKTRQHTQSKERQSLVVHMKDDRKLELWLFFLLLLLEQHQLRNDESL